MKIVCTIFVAAVFMLIAAQLYIKYSIKNMVKWEDELISEQKASRNDSPLLEPSKKYTRIYYDDHDVSGLIDED